jgi:hypothetical protein
MATFCEDGNPSSSPIRSGEFIDQLSDHQYLTDDSVSWGWVVKDFKRKFKQSHHRRVCNF